MKLLKISALVLTAVLVLNACKKKKDDNTGGGATSKKDILMSHSWVATDILVNDTSWWAIFPDCDKDNVFTFKANNVVTTDEGASKCNSSDPQTSDDVWMLIDNDTKIVNAGDTMTIAELGSGKARFTMMDGSGKFEIRMGPKP